MQPIFLLSLFTERVMGSTVPLQYTAWKRVPVHLQVWRWESSAIAFNYSWIGGKSQRQQCWGGLGNMLIQHYPSTLSLFITGIKIVSIGHSRWGKTDTRKDLIQFPIKFKENLISLVIAGVGLESTRRPYHRSFHFHQSLFRLKQFPERAGISQNSPTPANTACLCWFWLGSS